MQTFVPSHISLHIFFFKALPACLGDPADPDMDSEQTAVWFENDMLCVRLLRRKNRPNGSGVLRRACSCRADSTQSRLTCPVHTLWHNFLAKLPSGAHPWDDVSNSMAISNLREALRAIKVKDADKYWTHDLRRGHADVCYVIDYY